MSSNIKVNKNRTIIKDEDTTTRDIFDNEFVQHSIPRSEFQYSWVTASVSEDTRSDYPFGFFTSSNALEGNQITSGSVFLYDTENLKVYFGPLKHRFGNLYLNVEVNVEDSSMELGNEFSSIPVGDKSGFTNVYNLNNNGPYGWPTWKQVRSLDNQVVMSQNKLSRYYVSDEPNFINNGGNLVKQKRANSNTYYKESPFLTNLKTLEHSVEEIVDERLGISDTLSYIYDFGNYRIFFSNSDLSLKLGYDNNLSTFYEDIYHRYNDGFEFDVNDFYRLKYSEVVWPRRTSSGLNVTRSRPYFVFDWRDERDDRTVYHSTLKGGKTIPTASIWPLDGRRLISYDSSNRYALDIYDNTYLFTTASISHIGGTGELAGVSQVFHNGNTNILTASALFTHPRPESSSYGVFFTNDTEFRMSRVSGRTPFADSYEKWDNELRAAAKDYSVIPEFRITPILGDVISTKQGNFLSDDLQLFDVTGTTLSPESDEFYKVYQTSDIFKDYKKIKKEHEDFAEPTFIRLNVEAFMRFTPYRGFYPAERTLELSKIFSESYADNITYTGSAASFRSVLSPLFAPGILYNSIKSGIGYSYPTLSSIRDDNQILVFAFGNRDYGGDLYGNYDATEGTLAYSYIPKYSTILLSQPEKLPFEAIIEPEKYLSKKFYSDIIMHPSGTLFSEFVPGSVAFKSDSLFKLNEPGPQYKLAVNNFLAETVDFFLENQSLKVLSSEDDNNPKYFNFEMNKEYKMRVYLRSSENFEEIGLFKSLATAASSSFGGSLFEIQGNDANPKLWIEEPGPILTWASVGSCFLNIKSISKPTFNMIYRPYFSYTDLYDVVTPGSYSTTIVGGVLNYDATVYGEPKRKFAPLTIKSNDGTTEVTNNVTNYGNLTFEHVSPPHNEGYSFVEYVFRPFDDSGVFSNTNVGTKRFTLKQVMENLTASYFRFGERPVEEYFRFRGVGETATTTGLEVFALSGTNSYIYFSDTANETTRIDDSVYLDKKVKNKFVEYDSSGNISTIKDDQNSGERWVIYPKWECPIFDFEPDVTHIGDYSSGDKKDFHYSRCISGLYDDTYSNSGTMNSINGLWSDKAELLSDPSKGLFLEVRDAPDRYIKVEPWTGAVGTFTGADFENMTASFQNEESLSLKDALGFKTIPARLGEVSKSRSVKEAIVLVPFVQKDNIKTFFKITEQQLQNPSETLKNTLDKMDHFVIPPKFNFKLYNGKNKPYVEPIVMYIFDFEYSFSQEDLSSIWQNISPNSNLMKKNIVIEHELKPGELLENLVEDDIQWLVFKVKQKAKWDYSQKTLDSSDDSRFRFDFSSTGQFTEPEYSYNWPYDYFSVVEAAKVEATVYLESEKATQDRMEENNTKKKQENVNSIKKLSNKEIKSKFDNENKTVRRTKTEKDNSNTVFDLIKEDNASQIKNLGAGVRTVNNAVVEDSVNQIEKNAPKVDVKKVDVNKIIDKIRNKT